VSKAKGEGIKDKGVIVAVMGKSGVRDRVSWSCSRKELTDRARGRDSCAVRTKPVAAFTS